VAAQQAVAADTLIENPVVADLVLCRFGDCWVHRFTRVRLNRGPLGRLSQTVVSG
jgi:hypothetical protein